MRRDSSALNVYTPISLAPPEPNNTGIFESSTIIKLLDRAIMEHGARRQLGRAKRSKPVQLLDGLYEARGERKIIEQFKSISNTIVLDRSIYLCTRAPHCRVVACLLSLHLCSYLSFLGVYIVAFADTSLSLFLSRPPLHYLYLAIPSTISMSISIDISLSIYHSFLVFLYHYCSRASSPTRRP
jgi:hypothetical protein